MEISNVSKNNPVTAAQPAQPVNREENEQQPVEEPSAVINISDEAKKLDAQRELNAPPRKELQPRDKQNPSLQNRPASSSFRAKARAARSILSPESDANPIQQLLTRARASVPRLFMNPDWQEFLRQQHAHIEDDVIADFGDAQAELTATQNATVLCDMGQFSVLKVTGEDAQTFLQNLLSSDVREVGPQRAQASSLNTPKGRMLATFLIWQTAQTISCTCQNHSLPPSTRNSPCMCCAAR